MAEPQAVLPIALNGREHAELQTAAHAIRDHHRQVEESLYAGFSSALSHAIEAGRKLTYAKSLISHGSWGPWVEQNLDGIDGRTERLYRQLAEAADDGRLPTGNAITTLSIRHARELLIQTAAAERAVPTEGEDSERRSREPSVRGIARRALVPLRSALAEDSGVDYEQLVEALAGETRIERIRSGMGSRARRIVRRGRGQTRGARPMTDGSGRRGNEPPSKYPASRARPTEMPALTRGRKHKWSNPCAETKRAAPASTTRSDHLAVKVWSGLYRQGTRQTHNAASSSMGRARRASRPALTVGGSSASAIRSLGHTYGRLG